MTTDDVPAVRVTAYNAGGTGIEVEWLEVPDPREVIAVVMALRSGAPTEPEKPARAQGGPVKPGRTYLVGEQGPEFLEPVKLEEGDMVTVPNLEGPCRVLAAFRKTSGDRRYVVEDARGWLYAAKREGLRLVTTTDKMP